MLNMNLTIKSVGGSLIQGLRDQCKGDQEQYAAYDSEYAVPPPPPQALNKVGCSNGQGSAAYRLDGAEPCQPTTALVNKMDFLQ